MCEVGESSLESAIEEWRGVRILAAILVEMKAANGPVTADQEQWTQNVRCLVAART